MRSKACTEKQHLPPEELTAAAAAAAAAPPSLPATSEKSQARLNLRASMTLSWGLMSYLEGERLMTWSQLAAVIGTISACNKRNIPSEAELASFMTLCGF